MRATKQNKLTDRAVKNAAPKAILSDGGGLYVRSRVFVFRYTSPVTGKERDFSLGSTVNVGLKTARERAAQYRKLITQRIDPHDHEDDLREAAKAKAAANITFGEVAAQWVEAKLPARKSLKNQRAVRAIIARDLKAISAEPMVSVNTARILTCVKPLANRPAQLTNVLSTVHSIFDWAMDVDLIPDGVNPAQRKRLANRDAKLFAKREVKHNRFVTLDQLPAFMARLSQTPGNLARCLEFIIHTALRQNEAVNLRWDWIDLKDRSIAIPAASMKAGKSHVVYLSNRAHEIILGMIGQRRDGGLVFPGGSETGGVGLRSLRTFIMDRFPDIGATQIHGARASFKGFCTNANMNRMAVETSLAHSVGNATESAYLNPSDIRAARQTVMDAWSEFLSSAIPPLGGIEEDTNVVSLHAS
jgi:integrase